MFKSGQCGYISPGFPALHYKDPHYIIAEFSYPYTAFSRLRTADLECPLTTVAPGNEAWFQPGFHYPRSRPSIPRAKPGIVLGPPRQPQTRAPTVPTPHFQTDQDKGAQAPGNTLPGQPSWDANGLPLVSHRWQTGACPVFICLTGPRSIRIKFRF
ncbi:hypothetical protein CROQUDRAFT_101627 [Cronartium quercuum f. sp. fusiforme G11]|uniref:Uncharacterized protein n=1 Tax=Cronartium quercuum f. sp. fusiforme G11 TaxID=708437 RepID=A0A9P6T5C4_9BASI|nr:hypothetical protein CROQUDRAFT_101627 [Cronartium quercuum f. sp. fusiforme G11]